jgi:hypothetical protein
MYGLAQRGNIFLRQADNLIEGTVPPVPRSVGGCRTEISDWELLARSLIGGTRAVASGHGKAWPSRTKKVHPTATRLIVHRPRSQSLKSRRSSQKQRLHFLKATSISIRTWDVRHGTCSLIRVQAVANSISTWAQCPVNRLLCRH